jgi:hypothetical protein
MVSESFKGVAELVEPYAEDVSNDMSQQGKIEFAEKMVGLAKKLGCERSKAGRPGNGTDCSAAGLKEAPS